MLQIPTCCVTQTQWTKTHHSSPGRTIDVASCITQKRTYGKFLTCYASTKLVKNRRFCLFWQISLMHVAGKLCEFSVVTRHASSRDSFFSSRNSKTTFHFRLALSLVHAVNPDGSEKSDEQRQRRQGIETLKINDRGKTPNHENNCDHLQIFLY